MIKHTFMLGKKHDMPHVLDTLSASCNISSMVMSAITQKV
jgi:hypothetical protein